MATKQANSKAASAPLAYLFTAKNPASQYETFHLVLFFTNTNEILLTKHAQFSFLL